MSELNKHLELYTYDYLMRYALANIPDKFDKRQGSVIYTLSAPAIKAIADVFVEELYRIIDLTYITTSTGKYLDNRAIEHGITRKAATYAVKKGIFTDKAGNPAALASGVRFSTVGAETLVYKVTGEVTPGIIGVYLMECEQPGTVGNDYIGNIIPISYVAPLGTAELAEFIIPGADEESDDDFRARVLAEVSGAAFAGNIYWYDKTFKDIDGVGDVQIYPTWNGGGTVKISVVDRSYKPATPEFVAILAAKIDPENNAGEQGTGVGLAPIGHIVTVVAPEEYTVNVTANVTLKSGVELPQIQDAIETEIESYIYDVRKSWGEADTNNDYYTAVYTAQITSAILRVPGVANVTDVMTNGTADDKILEQTAQTQLIPLLGGVVISVG